MSIVTPSFGTIALILEGVGALLAMAGLGGSGAITVAVLLKKPSDKVSRWAQYGTTGGFIVGVPVAITVVLLLSN